MKITLRNISFTKNELKIIVFIVIVLTAGFSLKYAKYIYSGSKSGFYNYSASDNIFSKLSGTSGAASNRDSSEKKDTVSEESVKQKLKAAEDSLKISGRKKSKKEEKLKPKGININTATKEILIMLPGVGESTADKIISYRETHNGFKKIEHIMKVKGIGKKKFEKLKEYITVD